MCNTNSSKQTLNKHLTHGSEIMKYSKDKIKNSPILKANVFFLPSVNKSLADAFKVNYPFLLLLMRRKLYWPQMIFMSKHCLDLCVNIFFFSLPTATFIYINHTEIAIIIIT